MKDDYYQRPGSSNPNPGNYNEQLTYDKNGNIGTLKRNGEHDDLEAPLEIDNLEYRYHGNQLHTVMDHSLNPNGFKDSATNEVPDYAYDDFGNMIHDENKGIELIAYNHLNLPIIINFGEGKTIEYLYTAQGKKVKKAVKALVVDQTTLYDNGFQYVDSFLEFFPHAEGYVRVTDGRRFNYVYNYTDHLGNIRLSYGLDPITNDLAIMEENHYYPFGLKHKNYNMDLRDYKIYLEQQIQIGEVLIGDAKYKYKLNSREWQDELGLNMYAMDLRQYDPAIARWVVQDPVTHHNFSPYSAFDNNPVYWADPSGADSVGYDIHGRGKYTSTGMFIPYSERGDIDAGHGSNFRFGNGGSGGNTGSEQILEFMLAHMDSNKLDSFTLRSDSNGLFFHESYSTSNPFRYEWLEGENKLGGIDVGMRKVYVGGGVDFKYTGHYLNWSSGFLKGFEIITYSKYGWLGKNGKIFNSLSGKGPNGTSGSRGGAKAASNNYRQAGNGALFLAILVGMKQTYDGYVKDGNNFGYNAQYALATSGGGLVMSHIGARIGVSVGGLTTFWAGGVPGAVAGGFAGAVAGAYGGSIAGGAFVNWIHNK